MVNPLQKVNVQFVVQECTELEQLPNWSFRQLQPKIPFLTEGIFLYYGIRYNSNLMNNEHLKGALVRATRAVQGVVIPPKSLELVDSQETGSLDSGRHQLREVLIGTRVVEVRTITQTVLGEGSNSRTLEHERTERASDGVHSLIESWTSFRNTGSRITATGHELNENTEWKGCGCRGKNCSHRQQFRERLAKLGIDWKG